MVFNEAGLELVERLVSKKKPTLVLIDPLVAYMGVGVDLHKANETRAFTASLAHLAEQNRCAVVGIRHLTKSGRDRAIYRGIGTIDLTASARSVLLAGCDPDDKDKRALVHVKSNLAPMGESIGYSINDGKFSWHGRSSLTAARILAAENGETSALEEGSNFLREALGSGPVLARAIRSQAREAGISNRTLERAKADLGVPSVREGIEGRRGGARYFWCLPGQDHLVRQVSLHDDAGEQNGQEESSDKNNLLQSNKLSPVLDENSCRNRDCAAGDVNQAVLEDQELK